MGLDDPAATDMKPAWKRWVRAGLYVLFFLLFLNNLASFYLFHARMRDGSPIPTATHSVPLDNHGDVRYITPEQDQLLSTLHWNTVLGIPVMFLSAIVLHNLLGVRMFTRDHQ